MKLQFRPDWKTTLLSLLLLPMLMRLGFWQLEREQEKRLILAEYDSRQTQPHQDITSLWQASADRLAFLRVSASGVFDAEQVYLLDNKTRQGQVGFEVIQKLHLTSPAADTKNGQALWVNRGWIAANARRDQLPAVASPAAEQVLLASVYVPQGKSFRLAADVLANGSWPRVIQQLETVFLQQSAQEEHNQAQVFPYSLRLQADSPAALITEWQAVNVQPLKHRGYAIQWFAMAAALFIFYIFMSSNLTEILRRSRKGKPQEPME